MAVDVDHVTELWFDELLKPNSRKKIEDAARRRIIDRYAFCASQRAQHFVLPPERCTRTEIVFEILWGWFLSKCVGLQVGIEMLIVISTVGRIEKRMVSPNQEDFMKSEI